MSKLISYTKEYDFKLTEKTRVVLLFISLLIYLSVLLL